MFKDHITDIFFDLDHTLWDFERNSALTFQKILAQHHINIALDAYLEAYTPINFKYWKLYREEKVSKADLRFGRLKDTFDQLKINVPTNTINQLAEDYITTLPTFNHLFPNTLDILNYLQPQYHLHIITNGFEAVQERKLQQSGINKYFKTVINSEMAGVKKPNPIIFELALKTSKASAKNAVMIGDNLEADIYGAQQLEMNTIHFNSHQEPIDPKIITIHRLDEIKKYL